MRRSTFLAMVSGSLLAAPLAAEAQPAGRVPTVGYLSAGFASSTSVKAFVSGLRDLGYVEGKTVAIEARYAEERLERLPELASGLVARPVDVIVVVGGAEAHAAKGATARIPIVTIAVSDQSAADSSPASRSPGET